MQTSSMELNVNNHGGETNHSNRNSTMDERLSNTLNIRQTAQLDLDLSGSSMNRRSRYFAVSDTSDLTSPHEATVISSDLSLSGESRNSSEGNVSRREKKETVSISTDRSSNSSMLRQTSQFELELKPAIPQDLNENIIRVYPSCQKSELNDAKQETVINFKPALPVSANPVKVTQPKPHDNREPERKMIQIRIPQDSSIRNFARQISRGKKNRYDVTDTMQVGVLTSAKRPKSYFDLAVVTLCCCCSVLGFVSIILSVLSESNFKAKHMAKAKKYGKVSLYVSIAGMISTVAIAITVLLVFAYPWNQVVDL